MVELVAMYALNGRHIECKLALLYGFTKYSVKFRSRGIQTFKNGLTIFSNRVDMGP